MIVFCFYAKGFICTIVECFFSVSMLKVLCVQLLNALLGFTILLKLSRKYKFRSAVSGDSIITNKLVAKISNMESSGFLVLNQLSVLKETN